MTTALIQAKSVELNKLASEADALQRRMTGHLSLFDAACMVESDTEQEQRRNECHTLLDAILDNTRNVYRVGRELRLLTNP